MAKDAAIDDLEHGAKETTASLAVGEVRLIAPHEVGDAASISTTCGLSMADAPVDFHAARALLLQVMRNDLDEAG